MSGLLGTIRRVVWQPRRQPFGAIGWWGCGRKHPAGRELDPLVYHRSLRVEPMEERALLSVLQYCHVIYDPGTAAPPHLTSATVLGPADSAPLQYSSPAGMTPQMIRTAYDINSIMLGSVSGTGAGQTIAIIDAYDAPNLVDSTAANFDTSDLHLFDEQFGIPDPPSFLKLNETGGTTLPVPSGSSGWSVEESLDVEWAHAIAPQANIILFEANSPTDSDLITTAVNTARNWPGVTAVTMSFGRSESSSDTSEETVFTTPTGHPGVTFLASTGDSGAPGEFPAMSPNVVAVGGTTLTINSSTYGYISETGWSDGGGGQSEYEAKPSYQDSVNSTSWRQIPDVSFDADPNTGVAIMDSYDFGSATPWIQVGGTSVASPCWAGLVAIGDQLRASAGLPSLDGPTQTLPLLYGMKSVDFHDITTGSNGNPAKVGYDMATGIGTPVANNLVPDFVPVSSTGYVMFSTHNYEIGASATVTVGDLDMAGQSSCPVTLTSSAGDSEALSLSAVGGGIFTGSIPTAGGAVVPGDDILETVPGGTITVTYHDVGDSTTVTAQATTFSVDHFTFSTISGPETAGVPFSVTVSAYDSSNHLLSGYDGTATLTALGAAGSLSVNPTSVTFASGTWTGNVTVNAVDPTVTLSVDDPLGGAGTSSTFATQPGPVASFQWSTIASPQYKNVAFPVTMTAKDANGYTVTGYSGTANLTGEVGTTTSTTMLGGPSPIDDGYDDGWTDGYSFTPSANFLVTDFLHFYGTQESLWTSAGTLLATQTFTNPSGSWVDTPLTTPVQLYAGQTYVVGVYKAVETYYYYGTSMSATTPVGTIDEAYEVEANAFPTETAGVQWWFIDLRGELGTYTSIPVSPTTATFVNGVWTGNMTVQRAATGVRLHVDDGAGQTGDSNTFDISNLPTVAPTVPANATVGDGTVTGSVSIPAALGSDLAVSVASSDPSRVTAPATVTIPAGDTSAPLPLTIIDNGLLYGPEAIVITTTAMGCTPGSATLTLHDDLTAVLAVTLPASANENAGVLAGAGTVTCSAPAQIAVVVQLSSSDTTGLTVPATVTIPAGQTSASFNVTMLDDHVIDGNRPITVTAQMDNWTSGAATMTDIDDDGTLAVSLPASGWEGQTLAGAGTLTLGGTLSTPLTVSLVSNDPTRLSLPATVTIPANQTTASFTVTLLNPGQHTGPVTDQLTATTASTPDGVLAGSATMVVDDSNVDHYTFTTIAGLKTAGVAFPVTATADDVLGNPILVYSGTAALTGTGQAGTLSLSPTTVTFASGTWTGNVTVGAVDPTVTLQLLGSTGATGTSNVFATQAGPLAGFRWSTIASPQMQGTAFPVTLTADDAHGYPVTSFGGTVSLSAQSSQGAVPITPTISGSFSSGVWTGSVTALQAGTGVYLVGSDGAGHSGDSNTFTVSPIPAPDLTVALTDSGNFKQGDIGDTYTITVANSGTLPTTAPVSLADLLPAGLTATAISGSGWTTNLATLSATRSDVLAAGASYPALTVTVSVALNAPASVTNEATVSGGGEINTGNDAATDVTPITQFPDMTVTKTHVGNFMQGDVGDAYTITVSNVGAAATSGTVTVVDSLPAGLTATAMSGSGWTVNLSTLTAARSNVLAAGASYPALTLFVNVSLSAPASLTNTATVSGGGEINTTNDTAGDPTVINPLPAPTVSPITASINTGMVEAGTQVLGLRFSDAVVGGGTAANYELQSAGPDGLLGTADDQIMPLAVYYDGTTATLTVPALPEGVYRLTVFDTITNAKGVALDGNGVAGSNWVRDFVVTPSSQLFASTPTYPTGGVDPVSIVSGDFTGNGLSDLAVANYTSGTVSVLLADGSGGFSAATTYSSGGSGPRALVAGDFNHDGNLDLAVANYGSNNIGLLLGNGQGGFAAPATFATGGTMPDALAAGDFNHDGKLDLAVANSGSNNVSVLLGNGHGGFATAATYGTGSVNPGAHYLALGDFNGDGNLDIAVDSSQQTIGILLGNGSGGFAAATTAVGPDGLEIIGSLAAADFNGDGLTDLAIGGDYYLSWDNLPYLAVMLATGNGAFGTVKYVGQDLAFATEMVVGDFNGDGKIDIAAADEGNGTALVLFGDGAGDFARAIQYSCGGGGPSAICVGDFNGDGQSDLALALPGGNLVGVLLGEGNGSFAAIASVYDGGGQADSVATGDFNGDGRSDVAAANESYGFVSVLLADSLGALGTPTVYSTGGYYPAGPGVGDFNGDGKLDLAVPGSYPDTVAVFLGDGNGGFSPATAYPSDQDYANCIAVGDFNGDGKPDVALSDYNGDMVTVMLGNGHGGFGSPTAYSTGGTGDYSVAVGDFNGDGKEDLVTANYGSGTVSVLLGDGTGKFGAPTTFSSGGTDPICVAVGDFNGDGKTDIAVANSGSDTVGVLWGNGNGGFSGPTILSCNGFAPSSLIVGDFNSDGHTDLAVCGSPDTVAVFLGNGSGGFTGPVICSSGGANDGDASIATGDFNGDGRTDLAVANGGVGVLLNIYGPAPTALASQDGTVFDVATGSFGAGQLVEGTDNAFHGDGRLLVGGSPYSPTLLTSTVGDGGCSITTGTGTVAGLSVSRKITVPNTGSQDFARTLDSFTNPTGSPITTAVTVVGDLGSGVNTNVFATSDGTGIVSPNDQWIGTDGGGTPAVIHYIHGPAGLKPTSVAVTGSNISWTYNITVPAGQTVTLAYFTVVSTTPAAAIAAANALVTPGGFGGQAGAFLTTAQLSALANFLFLPVAAVALNTHSPWTSDVLTATATDWDPYGYPVTLTYVWSVNGSVEQTDTSTALTDSFDLSVPGNDPGGDVVSVTVTPNDGVVSGAPASDSATVVQLAVALPSDVTEGVGTVTGTLSIPAPVAADSVVTLASSDTDRLTVPATVTIPAGQTSVALPVTIVDTATMYGPEAVTVTATLAGYNNGVGTVTVHDDKTAVLSVSLPASADEDAGVLVNAGTVTSSAAAANAVVVQLSSSDTTGLTVPATVTIPAGQTSASFNITMHDDQVIESNRPITVTAQMDTWTPGAATMTDIDDDGTLAVNLPASGWEGQTLTGAGTLTLGGTLSTPLTVALVSNDPSRLSVPATVTIPANHLTATFTVTLLNPGLHTGPVTDGITATATTPYSTVSGSTTMVVDDSNVDHYTFTAIAGSQTAGVAFPVTMTADDIQGNPILVYNGTASLTAAGQSGTLPVTPTSVTFASGTWTGNVTVGAADPAAVLTVTDSLGHTGSSNPFVVGVPDLTITKTHVGNFAQGDAADTYTIIVSNVGSGPTYGTVSVVDTMPTGLTATAMSGSGWTVNLATLTAARSDSLAAGASYPALTVTVGVSQGAPASVTNVATVSGGGELNTGNDTARDPTTIVVVPPTITSTAPSLTGGMLANGATTLAINFSKVVVGAGTTSNYELQSVGPDGLLGTADDVIVPLSAGYSGTTATLTFAALPQSVYRLTVSDAITDSGGTPLDGNGNPGSNYVCDFVVPPPTTGLSFAAPVVTSCGTASGAQVVGDFTNNGQEDLVVSTPAGLTLMLGNGSGGFSSATVIPGSSTTVKGLAVGDFNHDGNLDLVATVANVGAEVFLGDGKGDFSAPLAYAVTGAAIATGDFNGDGITDLAVANYANSTVSVLLGNGTGGFGAPTTYSTGGTGPRAIVAADFNGDGKLDLAVANYGSGNVGLLLGNGAGGFSAATVYSTGGSNPQSLAVADFNGDGKPDLAVVNYSGSSNTIAVLLGNGTGGFSSPALYATTTLSPWNVVAGDFAGNGKIDLAVSNAVSPGVVSVLPGNGDGTFGASIALNSGGNNPESLSVGDFNGDGQPDLVVGNNFDGTVGVLLNAAGPPLVTLATADGSVFDVQTKTFGAGQLVAGTNNPFHGLNRLKVGGADYQPAGNAGITDGGQTVAVAAQTLAGLSVSRQVTVPDTGSQDFARTLDSFTNPTGSPISTTVTVVGDLGSGVNTTVFATSDGTGIVSPNDQWIGADGGAGTPAVIQYIHGPAGLEPTSVAVTGSNICWTYNITVPAGQTVTLAYFTIVGTTPAGAIAAANALVTAGGFGGQAGAFLSTGQLSALANFLFAPSAAVVLSEHSPLPADVLTATATDSDSYGNPVTLTYVWTVNGTVERTFTSAALTDTFNLSTLGAGDVGDTIVVSVTPNDGILTGTTVTDTATVINTPRVTNVVVGSDAWSSSFLSYLAAQNPNNAGGYSIPVGSGAQLLPLPWTNIDEIKVTFNENVTVAQADLMLVGVNTTSYNVAGGTFGYNAATFTATWTLPAAIPDDKLLLELNAAGNNPIEDALGNRLDGAWTNPTTTASTGTSQYPSGDGMSGGNFLFRFNVLPGDVSQDGYVEAVDGLLVRGALGAGAGQGAYSIFKDMNGDGYVLSSDGLLVLGQLGNSLPAAAPVATLFPAAMGNSAVSPKPSQAAKLRPLDVALLSVTEQLENGGLRTSLLDSPAVSSPGLSAPAAIGPALGQTNQGDGT